MSMTLAVPSGTGKLSESGKNRESQNGAAVVLVVSDGRIGHCGASYRRGATPPLLPLAAPHVSFRGSVELAFGALRPLRVYANAAHLVMRMGEPPIRGIALLRKLLHTATGGHFAVSARSVHTPTTGGDEIPCCGCALRAPNDDGCGSDSDGPVTRAVLYGANPDCDFPGMCGPSTMGDESTGVQRRM
ncbi:hypothetical protein EDB84DRAFT_1443782 [Lactarius hengduanensis]|nr:hypothetical protein EDB84DRAFT_1443782 [Lactarius hengduanensis]